MTLPYIPEDVQNIILSYVPITIHDLKSLALTSKKYNKYFFCKLESLYWLLVKKCVGEFWCNTLFSGWWWDYIHLKCIITDKMLRILEKAMIEFNEEGKKQDVMKVEWTKLIIRQAYISDEGELRLRKFWTQKLGKNPCNLFIGRMGITPLLITKTMKQNIYFAEKFLDTYGKENRMPPYFIFEYLDKYDSRRIEQTKIQTKKPPTNYLKYFKKLLQHTLYILFFLTLYPISIFCMGTIFYFLVDE